MNFRKEREREGNRNLVEGQVTSGLPLPPDPEERHPRSDLKRPIGECASICEKGLACRPGDRDLVEGKVTSDISASFPQDEEVSVEAKRMNIANEISYLSELKRRGFQLSTYKQNIPFKIKTISVLPNSCIRYKNEAFEARGDHIIYFISQDCKFTTESSKKLESEGLVNFEALLSTKPQMGNAVVFKQENKYIFHLVVKSTYDERLHLETVRQCLVGLKNAIDVLEVKTCSVSKTGNGLDRLS